MIFLDSNKRFAILMVVALAATTVHASLLPSIPGLGWSLFGGGGGGLVGKLLGGDLVDSFLKSSFMGSWNRVSYCIISSKISYSCAIPNVKFFIYTQLIHYPWFIGPLLSGLNIVYLLLNYLPYVIKDIACVVKALALGSFGLPHFHIPFPHLGWPHFGWPHFHIPFLMANNTMALTNGNYTAAMSGELMANYPALMQYYAAYAANVYLSNVLNASSEADVLFPEL